MLEVNIEVDNLGVGFSFIFNEVKCEGYEVLSSNKSIEETLNDRIKDEMYNIQINTTSHEDSLKIINDIIISYKR